ncbi:MAG: hypothetical protein EB117_14670 [Betaproteobacteria bacterium]|nr:hypothetical protein [Betaproteobacteria bacterium]
MRGWCLSGCPPEAKVAGSTPAVDTEKPEVFRIRRITKGSLLGQFEGSAWLTNFVSTRLLDAITSSIMGPVITSVAISGKPGFCGLS